MFTNEFVTFQVKGGEYDVQQGFCLGESEDTLYVIGESGVKYFGEKASAVIVPSENLWGETLKFCIATSRLDMRDRLDLFASADLGEL